MNFASIQSVANILFFVIIVFLAIAGLLSTYIFIKYGRSRSITILISIMFAAVFVLQTIVAFAILQQL